MADAERGAHRGQVSAPPARRGTEIEDTAPLPAAPRPPDTAEKTFYLRRYQWLIVGGSIISLASAGWSGFNLLALVPLLRWLAPCIALGLLYALISLAVNIHRGGFDFARHRRLVERWEAVAARAGVDILLPTAGEELTVLANTWNGVRALCAAHEGEVTVYVLDDADRPKVKALAEVFGYRYSCRPDRGWFKKSGNLRHGYNITQSLGHQFVVIFDADFRPRTDFLSELLPYFYDDASVGLVQSPQYFDVRHEQTWLQRGAGAVQEFFYRYGQVARQTHDGAICVGTNAIYRRAALDATGGTALIEHSEDVHTGFNIRIAGWKLLYVPIILAKGVCPDDMGQFFRQQYRWCMGSMSLLGSRKFWRTRLRPMARLCYFSGFFYYICTGLSLLWAPIVPLMLLTVASQVVNAHGYLFIAPAAIYSFVIWPLWHRCDYGSDAWAVRHVYSWAHLFALVDVLRRRPMGWSPTGTKGGGANTRYHVFRVCQMLLSFLPSLAWMGLAGVRVVAWHEYVFLPLLLTGIFVSLITGRVTFYRQRRSQAKQQYQVATGSPTTVTPAVSINEDARVGAGVRVRVGGYR